MLGQLPTTLDIHGKPYKIRSDYRNILRIFEAFADNEINDREKLLVCLKRLFVDFSKIPQEDYPAAYQAAYRFLACNTQEDGKPPIRIFNWIKDEQIIFPAVNKVAGMEVRSVPYMHWWTFLGYFESVDPDGLFGTVLSLRQKKARGKKLEKYEQEFWRNNKAIMALDFETAKPKTADEKLSDMFNDLLAEAGD